MAYCVSSNNSPKTWRIVKVFWNITMNDTRPTVDRVRAFYVIVIYDLQKMAALLIGLIDWTIALGGW